MVAGTKNSRHGGPSRLKPAAVMLLAVFWALPLRAQFSRIYVGKLLPLQSQLRWITSHPAEDREPALSPDGRWLVFVSSRSGNRDLWLVPAQGGRAVQITRNKADDYSPCWGGRKTLYFVSTRSDARGDIWKIVFNPAKPPRGKRNLKRITSYLGYEGEPACSPDGRWLAFSREDSTGQKNIWILDLRKKRGVPLTHRGGFSPAWSPDGRWLAFCRNEPRSQTALLLAPFSREELFLRQRPPPFFRLRLSAPLLSFPFWDRFQSRLFCFAHETDWDGDGRITIFDNPWLVAVDLDSAALRLAAARALPGRTETVSPASPPVHLTAFDAFQFRAAQGRKRIFLTLQRNHQSDIAALDVTGQVPALATATAQLSWADSAFSSDRLDLLREDGDSLFAAYWSAVKKAYYAERLLAYQAAADRFPATSAGRRAKWTVISTWAALGDTAKALREQAQLEAVLPENDPLRGLLQAQRFLFTIGDPGALADSLAAILETAPLAQEEAGFLRLRLAKLRLSLRDTARAGALLRALVQRSAAASTVREKALLLRARIASSQNRPQRATAFCLQLLKEGRSEAARLFAARKLLELAIPPGAPVEVQHAKLRELLERYPAIPFLSAYLHLRLAQDRLTSGSFAAAAREFQFVLENFPRERIPVLLAAYQLVQLWQKQGNEAEAVLTLGILQNRPFWNPVERGFLRRSRRQALLRLAEKLEGRGRLEEALHRYRELVLEDPALFRAHQGLVRTAAALNKLAELRGWYQSQLRGAPQNPYFLYGLGLVDSKLAGREIRAVRAANNILRRALARAPTFIPIYLALGRNYEHLEVLQHAKLRRKGGQGLRLLKGLVAPVLALSRKLIGYRPMRPQAWLERGIDVLEQAVELNNESENPQLEAELRLNLGNHYFRLGESGYEKAYTNYRRKFELDSTFRDERQAATVFRRFGRSAMTVGDWPAAERAFRKAISLYHRLRQSDLENACRRFLGESYLLAGDYRKAVTVLRQGLKRGNSDRTRLPFYRDLAYCYLQIHKPDSVRFSALAALRILQKGGIPAPSYSGTAVRLRFLGYSVPVWNFSSLSSPTLRRLYGPSPEDEEALLYTLLAQNEIFVRDLAQAAALLQRKLAIFRRQKDLLGQAVLMNNLGLLQLERRQFSEAAAWLQNSLNLCRKNGFLAGEALNLIDLIQLFLLQPKNGSSPGPVTSTGLRPDELLALVRQTLEKLDRFPYMYEREKVALCRLKALLVSRLWLNSPDRNGTSGLPAFVTASDTLLAMVHSFESAADRARRANLVEEQAEIWRNLGELLTAVRLYGDGDRFLARAERLVAENGLLDIRWHVLVSRGEWSFRQAGKDSLALSAFLRARGDVLNRYRYRLFQPLTDGEASLRDLLYGRLIALQVRRKKPAAALQLLEEWEHLRCLDGFRRMRFFWSDSLRGKELKEYRRKTARIRRLRMRYQKVLQRKIGGYRLLEAIQDSLAAARAALHLLQRQIAAQDSLLLHVLVPEVPGPAAVRANLSPEETVLVLRRSAGRLQLWGLRRDSLAYWDTAPPAAKRTAPGPADSAGSPPRSPVPLKAFQPEVAAFAAGTNRLHLIPTGLPLASADSLLTVLLPRGNGRTVSFATSLADLMLSKRTTGPVAGRSLFWTGADSLFRTLPAKKKRSWRKKAASSLTEEAFRKWLRRADVLVLGQPLFVQKRPFLASFLRFRLPGTPIAPEEPAVNPFPAANDGFFHLSEWPDVRGQAALLVWPDPPLSLFRQHPQQTLLRAALRLSGVQNLLLISPELGSPLRTKFLRNFLKRLPDENAAVAFQKARAVLPDRGKGLVFWFGNL